MRAAIQPASMAVRSTAERAYLNAMAALVTGDKARALQQCSLALDSVRSTTAAAIGMRESRWLIWTAQICALRAEITGDADGDLQAASDLVRTAVSKGAWATRLLWHNPAFRALRSDADFKELCQGE